MARDVSRRSPTQNGLGTSTRDHSKGGGTRDVNTRSLTGGRARRVGKLANESALGMSAGDHLPGVELGMSTGDHITENRLAIHAGDHLEEDGLGIFSGVCTTCERIRAVRTGFHPQGDVVR